MKPPQMWQKMCEKIFFVVDKMVKLIKPQIPFNRRLYYASMKMTKENKRTSHIAPNQFENFRQLFMCRRLVKLSLYELALF